jgi:arabinofuranan 3-O-arabinosyltransferase
VTGEQPQATVVEDGRFRRTIEVAECPDGCWLVFGEGYNEGWTATGPDGSLGDPQLVDGGFNGWRIEATESPISVTVEWTQQSRLRLAMLVSLLGVIAALVVLALDRRRRVPDPGEAARQARLSSIDRDVSTRSAAWLTLAWTSLSALLISPEWALAGAVAGLVVVVTRRRRLVELTAWATLVVIGGLVTIRERRNAPAPNGSWPGVFESWHGLAMFAVVSVLVASLFVDDDGDRQHRVVDEGE